MELLLQRLYLKTEYTIGRLSVDGLYFFDTLEDRVRDLRSEPKIPGRTAISAGRYEVTVNRSPRFCRDLPRLLDVPGFTGILTIPWQYGSRHFGLYPCGRKPRSWPVGQFHPL